MCGSLRNEPDMDHVNVHIFISVVHLICKTEQIDKATLACFTLTQ